MPRELCTDNAAMIASAAAHRAAAPHPEYLALDASRPASDFSRDLMRPLRQGQRRWKQLRNKPRRSRTWM